MIEITGVSKSYEHGVYAVSNLSMTMRENEVFGMVGTNGAGKTTLLRMMCGILKPDQGQILVDTIPVGDNPKAKELIYFVPDDPYYFPNSAAKDMCAYLSGIYPAFDINRFHRLMSSFGLDEKRKIDSYSKGMKKQLAVILALSSRTKYLFCDETFDGLDPVMRQATKSLIASDMHDRGLGVIMTSHNLRELEDICDHIGFLHKGGVLLSKEMTDLKEDIQKIQVVFENDEERLKAESRFTIVDHKHQGRMQVYIIRHTPEQTEAILNDVETVFYEVLPLTLEEIFISETEVVGYDIANIIRG